MTLEQAKNNLLQVLTTSRIMMPNGALTAQEHAVLQQSLEMLYNAAKEKQEDKKDARN